MSTFHNAAYEAKRLNRREAFARIEPILHHYGISFLRAVRGLRWRNDLGTFLADTSQELEDVVDLSTGVSVTENWACACFDVRVQTSFCELYLYDDAVEGASTQSVLLAIPDLLYQDSTDDPVMAARLLAMLADLGIALEVSLMICGIDVEIASTSKLSLIATANRSLDDFEAGDYGLHTMLLSGSADCAALRARAGELGFSVRKLPHGYELWSLLNPDDEIFGLARKHR